MVSLSNHERTALRQAQGEREIEDEAKAKDVGWLWPELTLMGVESKIRVAQFHDKGANHVCTKIEHEAL